MTDHDHTMEHLVAERQRLRIAVTKAYEAELIIRGRLAANMPFTGQPVDDGDSDWKGAVE